MRNGAVISPLLLSLLLAACGDDSGEQIPVIETTNNASGATNNISANNGANATPNNGAPNNGAPNNGAPNNGAPNNGDSNNGASNNGTPNNTATNNPNNEHVATTDEVDPGCIDGQYAETLPDPTADISAELASYSSSNVPQFYDDILNKRYPVGAHLIEGGLGLFDCVGAFARSTSTAEGAIGSLAVVVHECAHAFDLSQGVGTYVITEEQTLSCSVGGATFARSLIGDDEYQELRPPCSEGGFANCDHYYDTYLDGRGSDQGFDMVLEETVQYVNSLATSYAFQDYIGGSTSALDGLLTFLWYTQRYLRMARLEYPDDYARLTEPCWREAILTTWGRAWWIISVSEGNEALGIFDEPLFELVRDPELLGEIQRLRDLEGC